MKTIQAIQAIEEQQKQVKERSAAWMVGEQLKDICRREREVLAPWWREKQKPPMDNQGGKKQKEAHAA